VAGAAVEVHAPVDVPGRHLRLERVALLCRDDRVLGAEDDEHRALDVGGVLGPRRAEPGVEAHDGLEVGAGAGQFEHHRAAEAEADRRHPVGIGLGLGQEDVEPGLAERTDPIGVAHERPEPGHHLVHRQRLALAVVVEGEGDVAELGQPLGLPLGMAVESRSLVSDEDGRPLRRGAVVDGQVPDEPQPVRFVLDVLDAHGCEYRDS